MTDQTVPAGRPLHDRSPSCDVATDLDLGAQTIADPFAAKLAAGVLTADELPPALRGRGGGLRPVDDLREVDGDPPTELADLALAVPPGVTSWDGALYFSREGRGSYDPSPYRPGGDPDTLFDDRRFIERLRYG